MGDFQIFKKVLPYLAVFIFAFGYAGVTFTQQISSPASADNESITADVVNTQAGTALDTNWKWNVLVFVKSYFKNPFALTYKVSWCNRPSPTSSKQESCDDTIVGGLFKSKLASGELTVTGRDFTQSITHPSVNCGLVKVFIYRNDEVLSVAEKDTGIDCQTFGINGVADNSGDDTVPGDSQAELINDILFMGHNVKDVDSDTGGDGGSGGGNQGGPGSPSVPTNPGQPVNPTGDAQVDNAIELYNYILDPGLCGGTLTSENLDCLNNFSGSANGKAAIAQLKRDIAAQEGAGIRPPFQCVIGARALLTAATGYTFPAIGSNNCAKDMAGGWGRLGWVPNDGKTTPKPGDLAVWTSGSCGHIAFVKSAANGTFVVLESNAAGTGMLTESPHSISNSAIGGWLRLP